jgi:hypothetical protein
MAKIVKSTNGYWIGKELTKGSEYMTTDSYVTVDTKKVVKVAVVDLFMDIEKYLKVKVNIDTPQELLKNIAKELCHSRLGMIYCIDIDSRFGVRKIIK